MTANKRKKIATQADVARQAGVSRTTVSYVLNNATSISIPPATRQRIIDAAAELDYIPNRAARSLRTQKTYTIAGIIQDITNPFHPAFERGIQDVAEQHGYDLIMYNTDGILTKERKALNSARYGRVDGIIGSFVAVTDEDFLPIVKQGIPVVRLGSILSPLTEYPLDMLHVDNEGAAYTATNYLIGRGHHIIGVLTGTGPPHITRIKGYQRALQEHGILYEEDLVQGRAFSVEEGRQGMVTLVNRKPRPTAVFAHSDLMAMGALLTIREAGLRVPDDIAVIGFDNIFAAELVTPALTTIELPQRVLGQHAAEMLFARIDGRVTGGGRYEEIPYRLVIRESA
jgi:LacI family transcriptional regulator